MTGKTRSSSQSGLQGMDDSSIDTIIDRAISKFSSKIEGQINSKFEKIDANMNTLLEKLSNVEKISISNKNDVTRLCNEMDEVKQIMKKNHLRFDGIKETPDENVIENIISIIKSNMNVECALSDISNAYRVGKIAKDNKPRTIVVNFVRYLKRNEVFQAKASLKSTGIFINEDLTSQRHKLKMNAIQDFGKNNVWTMGGKIFARAEDQVKVIVK